MICVDASVAAKWLFTESYSDEARTLLRLSLREEESLGAPPLLAIEITNIIRQRVRQRELTLLEGQNRVAEFLTIPISFVVLSGLYDRTLRLAEAHNVPSAYDAQYLALAQMLGCRYWTDDQRLIRTLGGALPFVSWIADFRHPQ